MAYINFGKIDKKFIPILIGCIFSFFSRLLFTYKGTILFDHPLISNILATSSKYFTVIPFFIVKYNSAKAIKIKGLTATNTFIYRNIQNEIKKGKWKYIFLSAIIFFIQGSILFFTMEVKTNLYIWNILITCIFSHLVFSLKLYKHHYLSILLIIITGFILDLIYKNIQNDFSQHWSKVLLRFLREIIFSLHDIVNKYAMDTKIVSVYEISLYIGLITTVLFGAFSILDYFYFKLDNFKEYFDNFNTTELLVVFGYLITQLGLYLGALFTNKNNTPCHIFIIYIFGQLAYYFNFSENSIVIIICLVFILFLSLIFNEIIEINCFGLSDNTKRKIIKRGESEDLITGKNYMIEENEEKEEKDDVLIELGNEEISVKE